MTRQHKKIQQLFWWSINSSKYKCENLAAFPMWYQTEYLKVLNFVWKHQILIYKNHFSIDQLVNKISFTLEKKQNKSSVVKLRITPFVLVWMFFVPKNVPQKALVFVPFRSCGCQRISCKFLCVIHRVSVARCSKLEDICESRSRISCCKLGWCVMMLL